MTQYILATIIGVACLFAIFFEASDIGNSHANDVHLVWFLFSFTIVFSVLLAYWARSSGAIDNHGAFHGPAGELLSFLLSASLNIKASVVIALAITAIVVLPQSLSYLLSGFSGCASGPILLHGTAVFVIWGLIKSLVVAAGVALSVSLYGRIDGWDSWTTSRTVGTMLLGLLLMVLAFSTLYFYRGAPAFWSFVTKHCPPTLQNWARCANSWLTRKRVAPEGQESRTSDGLGYARH